MDPWVDPVSPRVQWDLILKSIEMTTGNKDKVIYRVVNYKMPFRHFFSPFDSSNTWFLFKENLWLIIRDVRTTGSLLVRFELTDYRSRFCSVQLVIKSASMNWCYRLNGLSVRILWKKAPMKRSDLDRSVPVRRFGPVRIFSQLSSNFFTNFVDNFCWHFSGGIY